MSNQPTQPVSFSFAAKEVVEANARARAMKKPVPYPLKLAVKLFHVALFSEAAQHEGNRCAAARLLDCGRNSVGRYLPPNRPKRKPVQSAAADAKMHKTG